MGERDLRKDTERKKEAKRNVGQKKETKKKAREKGRESVKRESVSKKETKGTTREPLPSNQLFPVLSCAFLFILLFFLSFSSLPSLCDYLGG